MTSHKRHAPTWIGVLVVIVLIAVHAALVGFAFRGHFLVALVAGLLGLMALKYAWWRLRR